MNWRDPAASDKHYWHRFSAFYERHFATLGEVSSILEYGVLDGASIRWLRLLFPQAEIVGVDILPVQPSWPVGPGITYRTVDQASRPAIGRLLHDLGRRFDLVIEDGSHFPPHQAHCLAETFPLVREGGIYILEDLHTSHPRHSYYRDYCAPGTPNCLHLLLYIEHLRATGQTMRPADIGRLAHPGMFTEADVSGLAAMIGRVEIFRRATLPLRCYACGTDDFDPVALVCRCGVDLDILSADSMTSVLYRENCSFVNKKTKKLYSMM